MRIFIWYQTHEYIAHELVSRSFGELKMADNDRRYNEEEHVVDAEGNFAPIGEGAGDELRQNVLHHEDEPDNAIGVGEGIVLHCGRARTQKDPHGYGDEAEDHQGAEDVHEDVIPIVFIPKVDVGPALQPILDG